MYFRYGLRGTYKGFRFRSMIEYSFMKHMETQGCVLGKTLLYETIKIPYEHEGKKKTYIVDFIDVNTNTAYELKHHEERRKNLPVNTIKWSAASDEFARRGISFCVLTDKDFPKLTYEDAKSDPDVIVGEKHDLSR